MLVYVIYISLRAGGEGGGGGIQDILSVIWHIIYINTARASSVGADVIPEFWLRLLEARVEDGLRVAIKTGSVNVSTLGEFRLLKNRENTKLLVKE